MNLQGPRVGIGVILLDEDNRVLLGKRLSKLGFGLWALPGGKQEYGETFQSASSREVFEECGLLTGKGPMAVGWRDDFVVSDDNSVSHFLTLYVLYTEFAGTPELKEPDKFEAWQWFSQEELPSLNYWPGLEEYVAKAIELKRISNE